MRQHTEMLSSAEGDMVSDLPLDIITFRNCVGAAADLCFMVLTVLKLVLYSQHRLFKVWTVNTDFSLVLRVIQCVSALPLWIQGTSFVQFN